MKISLHTKMINKNHTVTFKEEQTPVPPSEIWKIQKVYLILQSQITHPFDLWVDSWALENDNGYLQQVVPSNAASISDVVQRRAIEALASEMLILLPQIHFYLFQWTRNSRSNLFSLERASNTCIYQIAITDYLPCINQKLQS